MAPFVALGAGVSAVRLAAMLHADRCCRAPVPPRLHGATQPRRPCRRPLRRRDLRRVAVLGLSPHRDFGLANLTAVALLARLTLDGFISLWCAYAALSAAAIALHMRYAKPHREMPYLLT
jgi:hypothetical protein